MDKGWIMGGQIMEVKYRKDGWRVEEEWRED